MCDTFLCINSIQNEISVLNFRLIKNLPPEVYINILNNSKCIIGNSSSAIRDGSFLGVPAVNVGSRQNKRLHGKLFKVCSCNSYTS